MINKIKKSTIVLLAAALIGVNALPSATQAKDNGREDRISFSINNMHNSMQKGAFRVFGNIAGDIIGRSESGDNMPAISVNLLLNNNGLKSARTAYNQAIKDANTAFKTAKKSARDKFTLAINSSSNQSARISSLKTYLADLLVAIQQRNSAKQTALQKFIDALGNVQVNNQAPTSNAQSVTVTKNTSKAITLTGADPENLALTFTVLTHPTHGTLSGTVPNLTYFPATDFTGSDSFTFKVNDGSLDSAIATISMTVNP
ncbi:MAG: hypothetical protein A2528_01880 [Candidatus Staskawiczbacteria bacterium RIFOXYD2_FULL_37_9]|uniref:Cadherin-like domain-containing protein n=1 Tax=Candidatus Staskawiczbacteria bacterium RIFOXYB1_FULL_37_44 TaxID=1802223 RepID=A0A1G2IXK6_9BACT|nr:MAG: hypothetical protein A2358_01285 [Candidatus Staskawiczbacteria bacterium RIFOXYB1_FULL_37_44]OGZ83339.1 MAG: hypothetical protein A2416_02020 [Candidatus Staskawiczbacteria bacterium RIFOXYC1_FULL_37_52]OGZ88742.1 MAG: hypothetical protein A2581_02960 [Candidatus Staskawiczbacteria bacterium RIFOXYD1_FULL_37_110]OGZ89496.1 MAG: hypothetical protein A2444_03045 [Candidatus Staskawiczbacteria bacterium RIFOXYC2_FULL_37_19]OGZ93573.1 MAG: hypothetical protein A2528_01880 [Candidatus Stask